MNIKSLLLGSAAALVAVSGARAADAVVVAEPEPVEYVRVCDVYGAGFYYMPGTETCLKVSGYMRYDIGMGDINGLQSIDKLDYLESDKVDQTFQDTWNKVARFQLRVDARSETELGTLRAYVAANFQWDTNQGALADFDNDGFSDGPVVTEDPFFNVEHAYLELGGFRAGKTDSLFSTFTGYTGNIINDAPTGISYGPFDTLQLAYTWVGGNGFTAAVALEEGGGSDDDATININGVAVPLESDLYTLDSYVPHVVVGLGWTGGWGGITAVAGYDAVFEQFAGKARLDVKVAETLSLWVMGGVKSDDEFVLTDAVTGDPFTISDLNYYGPWNGEWAVWGGGAWQFLPQASFNLQISYSAEEDFAVAANIDYEVVPGFKIQPEIDYIDNFSDDDDVFDDDDDQWGGWLRLQRNF